MTTALLLTPPDHDDDGDGDGSGDSYGDGNGDGGYPSGTPVTARSCNINTLLEEKHQTD